MLPEAFPLLPLDLVQREGWGSLWSRELTSVSSVHLWTRETGVALVRRTPANFYVRLAPPPHLCMFDEVIG